MKYRSVLLAIIAVFILVLLDQLVKYWVAEGMMLGERIDILPFMALYHTRNTGIAFSMLSSFNDTGLIVLTVAIIGFVCWLLWSTAAHKKLAQAGYLLVIGGALGNLIDRVRFHYVTDYVLFHMGRWSFAIFNLADAFITLGAICIIANEVLCWLQERRMATSDD